jgi:hypothetical protein
LLTTSRVPVLAPQRNERIRLEGLLSDVWSRDILPFPGMTSRVRSEHVRASASHMMRKLSVASIASNFTKRSTSMASIPPAVDLLNVETRLPDIGKSPYLGGGEELGYSSLVSEVDYAARKTHLSIIPDEFVPSTPSGSLGPTKNNWLGNQGEIPGVEGPLRAMKRVATLKLKKSWQPEGHRIITPPLRASSTNNLNHQNHSLSRLSGMLAVESPFMGVENQNFDIEAGTENKIQNENGAKEKEKRPKGIGEGIRSLFR